MPIEERMDLDTAYRAVRGSLPSRRDVAEWDEKKFLDLFDFINLFIQPNRKSVSVIVTKEKWLAAEKVLDLPYHPWQELLYRIDRLTKDTRFNSGSCYIRIAALNRAVLGYLKNNPAAISDEMRKIIEPNPRLNWCLRVYTDTTTKIGADIVLPNTTDATGVYPKPIAVRSADKIMLEGQRHVFNLFELIASSIKPKDVKDMDVRDKIAALQKLSFIFNVASKFKANSQTFINLNVNAAKREDLEKALLDFGRHKEEA
jgi:hypothetical protein